MIGLDRDREAINLARERVPTAQILDVDLLHWVPSKRLERSAGLVIAGGDLLPLFLHDEELLLLMQLAARLVAPGGLFAIDATRMDPALLREAAKRAEWGEDVRWRAADGTEIVRDSRLLPDPLGRECVAQLQIRHALHGEGGYVDEREPFHVRAWSPAEVEEAASAAGLQAVTRLEEDRIRWLLRSTHA